MENFLKIALNQVEVFKIRGGCIQEEQDGSPKYPHGYEHFLKMVFQKIKNPDTTVDLLKSVLNTLIPLVKSNFGKGVFKKNRMVDSSHEGFKSHKSAKTVALEVLSKY